MKSAHLLGIPSSGTTGGVDNGVTVVVFSGSDWVVHGSNDTSNAKAQALVQKALNTLGQDAREAIRRFRELSPEEQQAVIEFLSQL